MMDYVYALCGQKCTVEGFTVRNGKNVIIVKPVNYTPCFEGDTGRHLVSADEVKFTYLF